MQKIILPIDTKSLYFNIKNDNESGHTATVATAIKQGNSINSNLYQIFTIPNQIDFQSVPNLIDVLVKNSKSNVKINNCFIFDKIKVNGEPIESDASYCMYVKEEIDPTKVQYGRVKLHYPISIKYNDLEYNIDNRRVIELISNHLNNYAFIVNAFEYDFDDKYLNFKITIIGENQIPYSKVFINNKGVGNKFTNIFNELADTYDTEIITLRKKYNDVSPDNYNIIYGYMKEQAFKLCKEQLLMNNYNSINCLSEEYPYSLYDFDYEENGITKYLLLFFTSTKINYFNLSSKKLAFINDFSDKVKIMMISSVFDQPEIKIYSSSDLQKFNKTINSIMMRESE